METSESIRASLILGEWVSSIDLSDAYFHISILPNSRKYLRFCHRSQVFQFTSLPFGLATAPQVFTMIVKEVKLMALTRGIRLHQYLDDWLIGPSLRKKQNKHSDIVDLTLTLKCSFVGYEYHLDSDLVKPFQERWLKFQDLFLRFK